MSIGSITFSVFLQDIPKVVGGVRCFSASFTDLSTTDPALRTCVTPARLRP